jgi:hypothetical protein
LIAEIPLQDMGKICKDLHVEFHGKLRECNLSLIAGCCLLNEGLLVGRQGLRTEADPDKTT